MDQFVLIGPSGNSGIVAKLSDLEPSTATLAVHERAEREDLANTWVLVDQAVLPKGANEMLLKVSRHHRHLDRIWTWLGCYFHADIPSSRRTGAYVGCGVAAMNADLDVEPIIGTITNAAMALYDSGMPPRVSRPVNAAEVTERQRAAVKAAIRLSEARVGLQPGSNPKAFIDLSEWPDNDVFNDKLVAAIHAALTNPAFEHFDEVILVNTAQLAERAISSKRYQRLTERDWTTPRPPPPTAPPVVAAPLPLDPGPPPTTGGRYGATVSDARSIADQFQAIDRRLVGLENERLSGAIFRRSDRMRHRRAIGAAACVGLAIFAAALYFLYPSVTTTPVTSFQNCPQHSTASVSYNGDSVFQPDPLEAACLDNQVRTARARLDQINANRDDRTPQAADPPSPVAVKDNAADRAD